MILVDQPIWPAHGRHFAHLVSDESFVELHRFAGRQQGRSIHGAIPRPSWPLGFGSFRVLRRAQQSSAAARAGRERPLPSRGTEPDRPLMAAVVSGDEPSEACRHASHVAHYAPLLGGAVRMLSQPWHEGREVGGVSEQLSGCSQERTIAWARG